MAQEGEIYPLQDMEERNQYLENQIVERTKQLSEAKSVAEAANSTKSRFLATMSHEIRTPLNALVGFSGLARTAADPAKREQYLAILEQSSYSLMEMVNDILDMSKIEAGRLEFEAIPFNLRRLVSSLEEQYRPLADKQKLSFKVVVNGDVPTWILGDPIRLRQILANLLANAVKFTESGSVFCSVSLSDNDKDSGHPMVRLEVCDTGIGIPEACREMLFQPFRQLDPSITRKFGGTGLGLAIVHSLTAMMKGNISIDSQEGVGSCFVIELPFQEAEPVSNVLASSESMASGAILIVEDNEFNRQLLGDILASWGQEVMLAENGLQALQIMENLRFDLILLDVRMPDIDGIEVARRIRRREQERSETPVPIIAVTADLDAATREECLGAGINAVLAKPVIPEQLARFIVAHCGEKIILACGEDLQRSSQTSSDLGNNPERTRQYREMLLQDIDDELQCLQAAMERDDRNELNRAAHTLKGLCGYLAIREPAELSAWLQHNSQTAQADQLQKAIGQLRHICTKDRL